MLNLSKFGLSKFGIATLFAALLSTPAMAASVSGATDFRVTIPEVLVLYHWDDAVLNLEANNQSINDATTRTATKQLGQPPYTVTGDVDTTGMASTLLSSSVPVTLKNAWAVRSISSAPVTLALTNPNPTLKSVNAVNAGTTEAQITTSGAVLQSTNGVTDSGQATITIPSGWEPVMGDIKFNMDLSKATVPGEYNTRGITGKDSVVNSSTKSFLLTLTGN